MSLRRMLDAEELQRFYHVLQRQYFVTRIRANLVTMAPHFHSLNVTTSDGQLHLIGNGLEVVRLLQRYSNWPEAEEEGRVPVNMDVDEMLRWFRALINQPYVQFLQTLPPGEGSIGLEVVTADGCQHQIHTGPELARLKYTYGDPPRSEEAS